MESVKNCGPCALNCQQITLFVVPLIVGVALAVIGACLTLVTSPTIAYSLLSVGGACVVASLVYLAVVSLCCQRKKVVNEEEVGGETEKPKPKTGEESKIDPDTDLTNQGEQTNQTKKTSENSNDEKRLEESSSEEEKNVEESSSELELSVEETDAGSGPITREKLKLVHLFPEKEPDRKRLLNYCEQVGGKDEAIKLLETKGKEPGDYTFYRHDSARDEFTLCVLDNKKQVQEVVIGDATIYNGDIYHAVYDSLLYPILPDKPKASAAAIHNTWLGYKNRALYKEMDGEGEPKHSTAIGLMQNFAEWVKGLAKDKRIRFSPAVYFKIVGHTFGLLGKYSFNYKGANTKTPQKYEVNYEGFTDDMGRSIIMQDILQDLKHAQFPADVKKKIEQMCRFAYVTAKVRTNPSASQLMDLLNHDIPITIFASWNGATDGHAVNITMTKKRLFFTNKGDGAGRNPGMRDFAIKGQVTEAKLSQILKLNQAAFFPADGRTSELEKILELDCVKVHKASYQKVGCCVFANNRLSYRAAALLLGVDEPTALKEFQAAKQRMRLYWLDAFFALVDKEEEDESLKNELYFFFLSLVHKLILKKKYNGKETSYDREILNSIEQRVKALQKEKAHPYLEKVIEFLAGKVDPKGLWAEHQKVLEDTTKRMDGYYKMKRA